MLKKQIDFFRNTSKNRQKKQLIISVFCRGGKIGSAPSTPNKTLSLQRIEPWFESAPHKKSPTFVELFCRDGRIGSATSTPNKNLSLQRSEPRFESATHKKSPTFVELFCRGGRTISYPLKYLLINVMTSLFKNYSPFYSHIVCNSMVQR